MPNTRETIEWLKSIKEKYIHGGDDAFDEKRRQAIDYAVSVLANGVTEQSGIGSNTFQLMREIERLKEEKESLANAVNVLEEINSDLYKQIRGVTVQEWISVKDRLPEEDGEYLVCKNLFGKPFISAIWFAKDGRKVDRYDFKNRWKNAWYEYDSEYGYITLDDVTHWMPLPQPPKGE